MRVVSNHPTVIGAVVTVRRPACIDDAVQKQHAGTALVVLGGEGHIVRVSVAGAADRCLDHNRAVRAFGTRRNVESMKTLVEGSILVGHRHGVQGLGRWIDDRRASYTDFRLNLRTAEYIRHARGGYPFRGIDEADVP